MEGERREEVRFNSWIQRHGSEVNLPHPASKEGLNSSSHSKAAKLIYTYTHFLSISLSLSLSFCLTHTNINMKTHTSPQSNMNASFYCMHCTAVLIYSPNLQGLYRVLSSQTQLSVGPPGFHTHLPFFTMGITESRQMPRRLPFTSKWTHPQAEAAILPLWCQALPHLCGHRAAAHSLHTDIHHSSWRMCRLTHKCA